MLPTGSSKKNGRVDNVNDKIISEGDLYDKRKTLNNVHVEARNEHSKTTPISDSRSYQGKDNFRAYSKTSTWSRRPLFGKPSRKVANHVSGTRSDELMAWITSVKSVAQGALDRNDEMEKQFEKEIKEEKRLRIEEESGPRLEAFNQLGDILKRAVNNVRTSVRQEKVTQVHNQYPDDVLNLNSKLKVKTESKNPYSGFGSNGSQSLDNFDDVFIEEEEPEPLVHQSEESTSESFLEKNFESEFQSETEPENINAFENSVSSNPNIRNRIFENIQPGIPTNLPPSDDSDIIIMSDSEEETRAMSFPNKIRGNISSLNDNNSTSEDYSDDSEDDYGVENIGEDDEEDFEYDEDEDIEEDNEDMEDQDSYFIEKAIDKPTDNNSYPERSLVIDSTQDCATALMPYSNYMQLLPNKDTFKFDIENQAENNDNGPVSEVELEDEEDYSHSEMDLDPQLISGRSWKTSNDEVSCVNQPVYTKSTSQSPDNSQEKEYSEKSLEESSEDEDEFMGVQEQRREIKEIKVAIKDEEEHQFEDFEEEYQSEGFEKMPNANVLEMSNTSVESMNISSTEVFPQSQTPSDSFFDPQLLAKAFISSCSPSTSKVFQVSNNQSIANPEAGVEPRKAKDYYPCFPDPFATALNASIDSFQTVPGTSIESSPIEASISTGDPIRSEDVQYENLPSEKGKLNQRTTPTSKDVLDKIDSSAISNSALNLDFPMFEVSVPTYRSLSFSFGQYIGERKEGVKDPYIGSSAKEAIFSRPYSFEDLKNRPIERLFTLSKNSDDTATELSSSYSFVTPVSNAEVINSAHPTQPGLDSSQAKSKESTITAIPILDFASIVDNEVLFVEDITEITHDYSESSKSIIVTIYDSEVIEPKIDWNLRNEYCSDSEVSEYEIDLEDEDKHYEAGTVTEITSVDETINEILSTKAYISNLFEQSNGENNSFLRGVDVDESTKESINFKKDDFQYDLDEVSNDRLTYNTVSSESLIDYDTRDQPSESKPKHSVLSSVMETIENILPQSTESLEVTLENPIPSLESTFPLHDQEKTVNETAVQGENNTVNNEYLENMSTQGSRMESSGDSLEDSEKLVENLTYPKISRPLTPVCRRTRSFSEAPATPRKDPNEPKSSVTPLSARVLRTDCQKKCLTLPDNDEDSEVVSRKSKIPCSAPDPVDFERKILPKNEKGGTINSGAKSRKRRVSSTPLSNKRSKRSSRKVNLNK